MGVTARQIGEMTPGQLMVTFFEKRRGRNDGETDPLIRLIRDNDARGRKGLPPQCPPWIRTLLTERTRGKPAR